jgi:chemotaxis protein methyltransferase CheR
MSVTQDQFDFITKLVRQEIGIVLEPGKEYLVNSRLDAVARNNNIKEFNVIIEKIQKGDALLKQLLLDSMTTNETLFFRDGKPFDCLKNSLLPDLIELQGASKKLTIWCAASSTGQEPYSLAILIKENFPALSTWDLKIVATDICKDALTKAREAEYSQFEVNRGLPITLLSKYFTRNGTKWKLSSLISSMVEFRELNLLGSFSSIPKSNLVLIRNVLIYFDDATKKDIYNKIKGVLLPNGYLMIGGSESVLNFDNSYVKELKDNYPCFKVK